MDKFADQDHEHKTHRAIEKSVHTPPKDKHVQHGKVKPHTDNTVGHFFHRVLSKLSFNIFEPSYEEDQRFKAFIKSIEPSEADKKVISRTLKHMNEQQPKPDIKFFVIFSSIFGAPPEPKTSDPVGKSTAKDSPKDVIRAEERQTQKILHEHFKKSVGYMLADLLGSKNTDHHPVKKQHPVKSHHNEELPTITNFISSIFTLEALSKVKNSIFHSEDSDHNSVVTPALKQNGHKPTRAK